jgi:multidrug efflux pump
MLCGRFIKRLPAPRETWLDRRVEPFFEALLRGYEHSLDFALQHRFLMLLVTLTSLVLTVQLFGILPRGLIPSGDTGLVIGFARVSPETSFDTLRDTQEKVSEILISDPDVAGLGSGIGGNSGFGASNVARFFMSLKPAEERKTPIMGIIARLRQKLASVKGIEVTMFPAQEIQFGARSSRSQFQVSLWSPELPDVVSSLPRILAAARKPISQSTASKLRNSVSP